jgi:DNA-binding NarL/FixJ family response regulator
MHCAAWSKNFSRTNLLWGPVKITEAEQMVLKLWASGFKAQHIAYTRGSSVGTVQAQLRALNRTFGTTNRGDLIQKAKEAGLL